MRLPSRAQADQEGLKRSHTALTNAINRHFNPDKRPLKEWLQEQVGRAALLPSLLTSPLLLLTATMILLLDCQRSRCGESMERAFPQQARSTRQGVQRPPVCPVVVFKPHCCSHLPFRSRRRTA